MKIWVTRTEPGASALAEALEKAGYGVLNAPVLEIRPNPFDRPAGPFDAALFLSVHGVRIAAAGLAGGIPNLFAVGRKTRAALRELGFDAIAPAVETSEGLLQSMENPAGKRVLIVTGAGGRNLLPEALASRGAEVTRLEVYVRYPLTLKIDAVSVAAIVVSSGDGFEQAARTWFAAAGCPDVPVLAPSARVASLGARLGLRSVHDCGGANADAVLGTLRRLGMEQRQG